jgi:hypothetical protein
MNRDRGSQRGINVPLLLLAMVLLTALAVGAKIHFKKLEARKEALQQEQARKAEADRRAKEQLLELQRMELDRQAEAARSATIAAQIKHNHEQMLEVARKWDDAARLSLSTPRYALPAVILQLQAARREMDDLSVHECLVRAKRRIVEGMGEALLGYEAFMRMGNDNQQARNELTARFQNAHHNLQLLKLDTMDCHWLGRPPAATR